MYCQSYQVAVVNLSSKAIYYTWLVAISPYTCSAYYRKDAVETWKSIDQLLILTMMKTTGQASSQKARMWFYRKSKNSKQKC